MSGAPGVRAVLFDFGGVILSSPFEAFARYEADLGLPPDTIRTINATNPDTNAWARLERSEVDIDGFVDAFDREAAALGFELDGRAVLSLLAGDLRPEMARAIEVIDEAGLLLGLLTNNVAGLGVVGHGTPRPAAGDHARSGNPTIDAVLARFDVVVESSKVGVRKPDPAFYARACEGLDIEPSEAVFLDDLGVNLKPARAMGMRTIKVIDPTVALAELETVLGIDLRG